MDGTIGLKDNGVNEAVNQGLAESCLAQNGVRPRVLDHHPAKKSLQQES